MIKKYFTKRMKKEEVKDTEVKEEELKNKEEQAREQESTQETVDESGKSELDELKDKYIRLVAEFENFKKRTIKERFELMKSAAQETMVALLPVLDDFDRAKKVSDDAGSDENFSEGVTLVYNKLHSTLKNKGLEAMDTENVTFDPDYHEALTEIPAPSEEMKGKIVDTIEKGYKLNDKIIRHAKVVVGK